MNHLHAFNKRTDLIEHFQSNAHLVYVMSIYLDEPDALELGSEALTDGGNDKKIDFIKLDKDLKKIVFAQGYFTLKDNISAPANKASDLNTAAAWLLSGELNDVPEGLRDILKDCREAILNNEIEQIDLLYVHNLPESANVKRELQTVANHLSNSIADELDVSVISKELGVESVEKLYLVQESSIVVEDSIICPAKVMYTETGPEWKADILTVPGEWLRDLFNQHGDDLFSANYRGFLGVNRRKKINSGIKSSAERQPLNFWVFNNGITILTTKSTPSNQDVTLEGISIINGAQTTGSIGSLDSKVDLSNVKVMARIIECSDKTTIDEIVRFNNTQNKITTWDKFSNDPQQIRIQKEFEVLEHTYSLKRGFGTSSTIGIETVAQPNIALEGNYSEANYGKNGVFENDKMYRAAFEDKKASHILLAFVISKCIDEKRNKLKSKQTDGSIIEMERKQLTLLRNLRFKYFFIALIGQTLEVVMGREIYLDQIGFKPSHAKASRKSIDDLISEFTPYIDITLTFASTLIDKEFSEYYREDNALSDLANKVKAMLYASEAVSPSPVISALRESLFDR